MTDYILTDNILRSENPIINHCLFIKNALGYKVPKGKMSLEELEMTRHPRVIDGMLKLCSIIVKSEVDQCSDEELDTFQKWMENTTPEWRTRVRNAPENLKTSLINGDIKTLKVDQTCLIRYWMNERVVQRMSKECMKNIPECMKNIGHKE